MENTLYFTTPTYIVKERKESKARYATADVGDRIYLRIGSLKTTRTKGLNSSDITVFVNGEEVTTMSQGELNNFNRIYELQEEDVSEIIDELPAVDDVYADYLTLDDLAF